MPVFYVHCAPDCDNVTHLRPHDLNTRPWGLNLKCTRCHEKHPSTITVDPRETTEQDGGSANFSMKCKGCRHDFSVSVVLPSAKEADSWCWSSENGARAKRHIVAAFDVRGAEIETLSPDGKWIAAYINGDVEKQWKFDWRDDGDEFAEYEEEIGGVATISKITLSVQRA